MESVSFSSDDSELYHEDVLAIKEEIIEEHEKIFNAFDTKSTGLLKKEQLIKVMRQFGLDVERKDLNEQINEWFSNTINSDSLTFEEFSSRLYESDPNSILYRALTGNLTIPDWKSFCNKMVEIFEETKETVTGGRNATYIPQLEKVDPSLFGFSLCTVDGQIFSYGDHSVNFCFQSCSKPLVYLLALEENSVEEVHKYVGREPSGASFNSFTLNSDNKPHNPMINAGAITICSLIKKHNNPAEQFSFLMDYFSKLAGGAKLGFDQVVYLSEKETAARNFALGYFMQSNKVFKPDTNLIATLELYFQLCSAQTNCQKLAVIASTFANNGVCPLTGVKCAELSNIKSTLQLMLSCGMYDHSGEWSCTVGIPAKSGVSGAIFLVVPNVMGLAVFSPPLDHRGNSVRGVEFCKKMSSHFAFSIFDQLINDFELRTNPVVLSRPISEVIEEFNYEDIDEIEEERESESMKRKVLIEEKDDSLDESLINLMTPSSTTAFLKIPVRKFGTLDI